MKCPHFDNANIPADCFAGNFLCPKECRAEVVSAEHLSTSDLIAELEKRRPCERCADKLLDEQGDCKCLWSDPFYGFSDNFKEAK